MSDEIKEVTEIEEQDCECKCKFCKAVKKILAIAVGTFIGFYCAMSLFFALHKPPMPPCHGFHKSPQGYEQNFEHKKHNGEHKKIKGEHKKQMPARAAQDED